MANKIKDWLNKPITLNRNNKRQLATKNTMRDSSFKLVNGANEAFVEDAGSRVVGDAYGNHAYVHIAVNKIANNINRADFELLQNDTLVTAGAAYDLFNNVNPYASKYQLWDGSVSWLMTAGEFIWTFEKDYGGIRLPKEIYVQNPCNWEHVLNKEQTEIIMWRFRHPSTGQTMPFFPSEIIHMKQWNPWTPWRGVTPLIAAADNLLQDGMIDATNVSLLKNRSTPSGLLSTDLPITEDQAKEYIKRWEKNHKGASRSGKVAVLGQNLKYQTIGLSPEEMQYMESKKWNRTTILATYGVPPVVAGYKDENTPLSGTDTTEQLKQFWNLTLTPIIRQIEHMLATDVQRRWTPKILYKFNLSVIPELQEDIDTAIERQGKQIADGRLTINEAREQGGQEPLSWGDTWWKALNLVPVTSAPAEPIEAAPTKELDIFAKKEPDYSPQYKFMQWFKINSMMAEAEKELGKRIDALMFKQRSAVLSITDSDNNRIPDAFWEMEKAALKQTVAEYLPIIEEVTNETLPDTITEKKIPLMFKSYYRAKAEGFTGIIDYISKLVGKLVSLDEIRTIYRNAKSKTKDLCRLELMHIFNEMRMKVFLVNGFTQHEYVAAMDTEGNFANGSVVNIGDAFINGKAVPFDKIGRNFSLPVIATKILIIDTPEANRQARYDELAKAMTKDERKIKSEVEDFWKWVGEQLKSQFESKADVVVEGSEGIIAWLKNAFLGVKLFKRIKKPITNTFSRGLVSVSKLSPGKVRRLTELYLETRSDILVASGSKVSKQIIDEIISGKYTKAEQIDRIKNLIDGKINNAQTIATTETTVAYNSGRMDSIRASDFPYKQWFHAGGGKVDRDHHIMDQIVGKEENFTLLNGVEMFAPGIGPAEEVYNCNCIVEPRATAEG